MGYYVRPGRRVDHFRNAKVYLVFVMLLCQDERQMMARLTARAVRDRGEVENSVLQRRPQTNELVISYLQLRKIVGWIGMLLPFVLMIGNWAVSNARPDSMSGYYYTPMRNVFVGSLCALGVFLIAYNGYDEVDRWITNIAGFCAVCVAFNPTKPSGPLTTRQEVVGDVHVFFAICTFTALGLMALRFAKREQTPDGQNIVGQVRHGLGFARPAATTSRHEIVTYRVCGFVILTCVLFAVLSNFLPPSVNASWPVLFILEATAVCAFGVSWFVKGRTMQPAGQVMLGRR